jgi:hypothetical protein
VRAEGVSYGNAVEQFDHVQEGLGISKLEHDITGPVPRGHVGLGPDLAGPGWCVVADLPLASCTFPEDVQQASFRLSLRNVPSRWEADM